MSYASKGPKGDCALIDEIRKTTGMPWHYWEVLEHIIWLLKELEEH